MVDHNSISTATAADTSASGAASGSVPATASGINPTSTSTFHRSASDSDPDSTSPSPSPPPSSSTSNPTYFPPPTPPPSHSLPPSPPSSPSTKPPLHTLLSTHDFESVASQTLSAKTWAFYSSAATDLITARANQSFFDRVWFRPRVLRNVKNVSTTCRIQGRESALPLFVSPAALAGMAHLSGEMGIARACERRGVVQCVSTNASYPIQDIVSTAPHHPPFFQLYVNKNRAASEALLHQVYSLGIRTIFLTVDAPVAGKREADERLPADETMGAPMSGVMAVNDRAGGGLARTMGTYIDDGLTWDDLKWLRGHWRGKVVLKGIMGREDAERAAREGVDGIVLSNHGGRNLDTSPPSLLVLLDLHKHAPHIFDKLEVYIDSGIRRGTDILKALCLGARAVGMGRSFLYAVNYGEEGVEWLIEMMQNELETAMRLVGITDLSQVHPGLVNTRDIDHLVPPPEEQEGHAYAKWNGRSKL